MAWAVPIGCTNRAIYWERNPASRQLGPFTL